MISRNAHCITTQRYPFTIEIKGQPAHLDISKHNIEMGWLCEDGGNPSSESVNFIMKIIVPSGFAYEEAEHLCFCGKDKSPDHLVYYPRMRRRFLQWPARSAWPTTNTEDGIVYFQQLPSNPGDFAGFLRLAKRA